MLQGIVNSAVLGEISGFRYMTGTREVQAEKGAKQQEFRSMTETRVKCKGGKSANFGICREQGWAGLSEPPTSPKGVGQPHLEGVAKNCPSSPGGPNGNNKKC